MTEGKAHSDDDHVLSESSQEKKDLMDNLTEDQRCDLQEAFDLFDRDGGGTISIEELKCLFRCFDIKLTKNETKKLLLEHDSDQSGEIDFGEFVVMMSKIILQQEKDPELYESFKVFN